MQQAITFIKEHLNGIYSEQEIRNLTELIIETTSGMNRTQVLLNTHKIFSEDIRFGIEQIVKRLISHEPIQYIIGETDFFGLPFLVDTNVLIPRPETSELIEYILSETASTKLSSTHCLDIGTGSGCIPIVLKKKRPQWQLTAIDISKAALQLACKNAQRNEVDIQFFQADILQNQHIKFPTICQFDIIVSNPPYICEMEKREMHSNVLTYEPHTALFVPDNDPLLFYRAITLFAKTYLKKNGLLFFEINRTYGNEVCSLLKQNNFTNVELRKDISGNDRFIKGQK